MSADAPARGVRTDEAEIRRLVTAAMDGDRNAVGALLAVTAAVQAVVLVVLLVVVLRPRG